MQYNITNLIQAIVAIVFFMLVFSAGIAFMVAAVMEVAFEKGLKSSPISNGDIFRKVDILNDKMNDIRYEVEVAIEGLQKEGE